MYEQDVIVCIEYYLVQCLLICVLFSCILIPTPPPTDSPEVLWCSEGTELPTHLCSGRRSLPRAPDWEERPGLHPLLNVTQRAMNAACLLYTLTPGVSDTHFIKKDILIGDLFVVYLHWVVDSVPYSPNTWFIRHLVCLTPGSLNTWLIWHLVYPPPDLSTEKHWFIKPLQHACSFQLTITNSMYSSITYSSITYSFMTYSFNKYSFITYPSIMYSFILCSVV